MENEKGNQTTQKAFGDNRQSVIKISNHFSDMFSNLWTEGRGRVVMKCSGLETWPVIYHTHGFFPCFSHSLQANAALLLYDSDTAESFPTISNSTARMILEYETE